MNFTVPQFIEKEGKIVGPLTFKQFVFVGSAGGFCLFLYFMIPSLQVFIAITIFIMGIACALAFLKVEKIPLPIFIKNMFFFLFKPKVYLWKKKNVPPIIIEKPPVPEEIQTAESSLRVSKKSRLGDLFTRLETRKK